MHIYTNNTGYYKQSDGVHYNDFTAFEVKSLILFTVQGEGDNNVHWTTAKL